MEFSEIINGKYSVDLDLGNLLDKDQRSEFKKELAKIFAHDEDFGDICRLQGDILTYQSETLLPLKEDTSRESILLVFGNPAIHSVQHGMFFFSRTNMARHGMWGKLAQAEILKRISSNNKNLFTARNEEAEKRRVLIQNGTGSEKYLLGLTTFYSFPTPVTGGFQYSDAKGVEKLFKPVLDTLAGMEIKRLKSLPSSFQKNMIFVQKSSYQTYRRLTGRSPMFWPVRGKGSSGEALARIIHEYPQQQNLGRGYQLIDKDEGRKFTAKKKPRNCPNCSSKMVASILWGYPDYNEDLQKKIADKKIVLGGCHVEIDGPSWQCTECEIEIFKKYDNW
ncbi:hypothetical protein ACFL6N_06480 [Thermodesulfobacteriota bacterium]